MSANAGEIRARLVLSNEEFKQKMNETRSDMKQTGFSAKQMDKDFRLIQKASVAVGGAVVAGIGSSVKVAADFEQSMARVRGISGSTAEEFARQEEAARKMGAETIYSASEAAEGMSYLAMAGFDVNEQIDALPSVLNAAIAGQIELGQSADIVSNIMTGFRLSAEDAEKAVDVLVQTSNSANTDIPQLGEAMKYVAPVASSLGWSIEETAAAIGRMSDAGIQGGQAGTSLRAALLALANPTGQTKEAIKDLNIELLDSEGNMKPLPELMGHIASKMDGMTDAQKTQAAAQLVGSQAASGFLALLKQGEDGLQDYVTELENSSGAAQKMADIQKDTLNGAFSEFKSVMEELGISIGQEFLPMFTDIVRKGTDVVSVITELDSSVFKSGLTFAGTAAAIALTITTIGRLAMAVKGLMASMGPAGWLIAGVSILGGVLAGAAASTESLDDAIERLSQEFEELQSLDEKIEEFDRLQTASNLTNDEFARFIDISEELNRATDPEKIEQLKDAQNELYEKSGMSNGELDKMAGLNDELAEKVPEATGKITDQGNAIIDTTDALKDYSREKLESLFTELDLKRLETEVEYKDAIKEEERIVKRIKDLHSELDDLNDTKSTKQDNLNKQQEILNDMKADENSYSDIEIQNQQNKVNLAETELRTAEENLASHAKKIGKQEEELENIRKEIEGFEVVREQLELIILKQAGINAEQGEGLEVLQEEIRKQEEKKRKLEENTSEAMRETDEYRNAKKEIQDRITELQGVYSQISEIRTNAADMNSVLAESINKSITYNYRSTGSASPHNSGNTPLPAYHTGGIVELPDLPKLHMGDRVANLMRTLPDTPLHNEIDVRLLRNEMVLTEGQQANLWKMIETGFTGQSTQGDENFYEYNQNVHFHSDGTLQPSEVTRRLDRLNREAGEKFSR